MSSSHNSTCDWLSLSDSTVCFYCDGLGCFLLLSVISCDQLSVLIMSYSREVLLATSLLCSSSGSMQLLQLYRKLLQCCDITEKQFLDIIQQCPRFLLVRGPVGAGEERLENCTVVAQTSLRLCSRYGREPCTESGSGSGEEDGGCQQLHLCKFFIYGNCRFGKGR